MASTHILAAPLNFAATIVSTSAAFDSPGAGNLIPTFNPSCR
jgi:hypothetical protein